MNVVIDPTTATKHRRAQAVADRRGAALERVPVPQAGETHGAFLGRFYWWLRKERDEALRV